MNRLRPGPALISLSLALTLLHTAARPAKLSQSTPAAPTSTSQLARLTYVEGDVQFNRGVAKHPDLQRPWEPAHGDLAIAQNFALKTGEKGRAEISFQADGAIYLAENSVLLFKRLASAGGAVGTEVELVSGTISTNIHPFGMDIFVVRTPVGGYTLKYPATSYERIDSLLDGMAFTPESDDSLYRERDNPQSMSLKEGQTLVYVKNSEFSHVASPGEVKAPQGWDNWVASRCAARQAGLRSTVGAFEFAASLAGAERLFLSRTVFECSTFGACCGAPPLVDTPEQDAAREAAERNAALQSAQPATVSVKDLQQEKATK
jgi:FecR-like protein